MILIVLSAAAAGLVLAPAANAAEPPVVRGFSFSPASFAVAAGQGGTNVQFRLSKRATVRIGIARRRPGRVSRGRCVKPTRRLAHRRRCTRHIAVGTLRYRRLKAGEQRQAFVGRVRGKVLSPGRYRAAIVAVDRADRRSRRKTAAFRIVRGSGVPPALPGPPGPPGPPANDPNQFPNPSTTGVPAGWVPAQTRSSDLDVNAAGTVVQDIRFTNGANLNINAPNVTVRRVELQGGAINTNRSGVLIEDVTLNREGPESNGAEAVISYCGYTARRVEIVNRSEGFRDGCGPSSVIEDSYIHIRPPASCGDWHGDGIQGYGGRELHVTNVTIDFDDSTCGATSPFFYVGGSGGSPDGRAFVNRLLITGRNGYAFRMGTPGTVQGLRIQDRSWRSGPISITDSGCGAISAWEAQTVNVDANYRVTRSVRSLSCSNG
jgi:hypothetical protein